MGDLVGESRMGRGFCTVCVCRGGKGLRFGVYVSSRSRSKKDPGGGGGELVSYEDGKG